MDNTQFENHVSVGGPYNKFDFERRIRAFTGEWGVNNTFFRLPKHWKNDLVGWEGVPHACCTEDTAEIIIICNEGGSLSHLYQVFTIEKAESNS